METEKSTMAQQDQLSTTCGGPRVRDMIRDGVPESAAMPVRGDRPLLRNSRTSCPEMQQNSKGALRRLALYPYDLY